MELFHATHSGTRIQLLSSFSSFFFRAPQVSDESELGPLQKFLQWCDQVNLVLNSKVGRYCTGPVLPNVLHFTRLKTLFF